MDFEIWVDYRGAHASFDVEFEGPDGEPDWDTLEVDIDLAVGPWEHSYYRPSERLFEIQGITAELFGKTYHFDLDELVTSEVERDRFMEILAKKSDEEAEERWADAHADY